MNGLLTEYHFLLAYRKRETLRDMSDTYREQLLRDIVRSGPSENSWNAILELFASWPENAAKEDAYAWCNQQLQPWKDSLRSVNSAWRYLYKHGNKLSSVAKIVRSIHILQREENGNTELQIICSSSYITNLKRLIIRKSGLYTDGLKLMVTSPYLSSLTHLSFESLTLNDAELDVLFSASRLVSLHSLKLKNTGLNTKRVTKLLQSPLIQRIEKLDLSYNHLDDESVSVITSSELSTNLRRLNLEGNFIRIEGAMVIAEAQSLRNIEELNMAKNHLTPQGKEVIRKSNILKSANIILD